MSLESDVDKLIKEWGEKFATDLNESLNKALKEGGSKNPQEAALNFKPKYNLTTQGATIQIIASGDYWQAIDTGRKAGKKAPPSDVVGKKWQNKHNINAAQVIYDIQVKYNASKGLKLKPKKLKYDKAAKSLGFLIARSIGKKGIKPKPYLDRVITQSRIGELSKALSVLMGKEIHAKLNEIK